MDSTDLEIVTYRDPTHREQVIALMQARGIDYPQLTASRYAGELRQLLR